jgi:type III secretion protein V
MRINKSDLALALFVLLISALLLVPLPTYLLDLLLVFNLSFGFILLLTALYIPNSVALFTFPTLLLLTTLFRLSLNVASTRLILSEGDAGQVISTFGTILVGSDVMVGIVLFAIITTVNFMVVARGAGRVSEVAARFVLDAMPGKQAAIEAEVRANLISSQEANLKREELRKESQLYGSMDGAMKFVQGDALAGIIIIFINIVAGLYIGVAKLGMNFSQAVETYITLTVGDGLVHQIPAILISICAGMVVTRVSSGEGQTIGQELGSQLLTRPNVLIVSGCLLILAGIFTVLPTFPFLLVGAVIVATGSSILLKKNNNRSLTKLLSRGDAKLLPISKENSSEEQSKIVIEFDRQLLLRSFQERESSYYEFWSKLAKEFKVKTGFNLPELKIVANDRLRQSSFIAKYVRSKIAEGEIPLDSTFVAVHPEHALSYGIDVLAEVNHPISGARSIWARSTPHLFRLESENCLELSNSIKFVLLQTVQKFFLKPEEYVSSVELYGELKLLEKRYPGLLAEGFRGLVSNPTKLSQIIKLLISNNLEVGDLKILLEDISNFCINHQISLDDQQEINQDHLLKSLRSIRKRAPLIRAQSYLSTAHNGSSSNRGVRIVSPSVDVSRLLIEMSQNDNVSTLSDHIRDPHSLKILEDSLKSSVESIYTRGVPPIVVMVRDEEHSATLAVSRLLDFKIEILTLHDLDSQDELVSDIVWSLN